MSLRSRILVTATLVVLLPLLVLGILVRGQMAARLMAQHVARVETLAGIVEAELSAEKRILGERLAAIEAEMVRDNRLRLAAVDGQLGERPYLLDYAGRAMQLAGLAMLQIQDEQGRVLSSGHFRNAYDRIDPLPLFLAMAPRGVALIQTRTPESRFLALARVDSLMLGGKRLTLVAGTSIEDRILGSHVRGGELAVSLVYPGGLRSSHEAMGDVLRAHTTTREGRMEVSLPRDDYTLHAITLPFVLGEERDEAHLTDAFLIISYPLSPLRRVQRSVDAWLAVVWLASAAAALFLALWLSARISRPIAELAAKTAQIDLDHLYVAFESRRTDEVGMLARFLEHMTARLRTSARKLREAERRATLGEVARQVNHDIKNGLTPIRNVFRHLAQVVREEPERAGEVYRERQEVLDASIEYLEQLAAHYARISTHPTRRPCDLGEIVRQVAAGVGECGGARVSCELAPNLAPVSADPVALRRIVENLVQNACESLALPGGRVTLRTANLTGDMGETGVQLEVSDTGRGIPPDDLAKIFDDFYTTKEDGTGLGLSNVRRLVSDFGGSVHARSDPGKGSTFSVWLPAAVAKEDAR